ncbi:MAG: IS256 family transposase [Candidatus Marinimicrobia bacterium]|nr:IS256 family transposase [Candidatus Neomarinimicrobiota bacterium]
MTRSKDTNKQIDNPEFLKGLMQEYLQEYLEQEVALHLGALPYERTVDRRGHRNGYKPRQLNTRVGKLFLSIPQARDGSFSTELFERYQRSEQALICCLQEMVINGVSTRKVKRITEQLCGLDFSRSQVSEISKKLDKEIQAWLNRPLNDEYPYLFVDARYNKLRRDHKVESHAVLIAKAVNQSGKRDIIGVDVCNNENETNWSDFFQGLKERGLKGVKLVISDAHGGLVSAIEQYYPGTQWQRCQVHFKKNILDKVRNRDKAWTKQRLDDIFHAPDKQTGLTRLRPLIEDLSDKYPRVADLLENDGEDALTCLNFPLEHRRRIRTTNSLERFNQEIKRRTNVIRIFPNRESAARLIGALCMEQSEEWITGRQYLDMSLLDQEEQKLITKKPKQHETVAA